MKRIGVGLIGANSERGWAARTHLPALAALESFRLAAVCTTNAASAQATAARYGVPHALTDPAELAALPEVELVVVSVRAPNHLDAAEPAIAAGKHVLVEWPLGSGPEQTRRLGDLARARGVRGFACLQGRFSQGLQQMRALISDGAIGMVASAQMTGKFAPWGAVMPDEGEYLLDARNGATLASIIGGHGIDMMRGVLGEVTAASGLTAIRWPETRLESSGRTVAKTAPDHLAVALRFAGGVPATLHLGGGSATGEGFFLTIQGTQGALRISGPTVPEILPPLLERWDAETGAFAPVAPDPAFRTAPVTLGDGPAANVAQLYDALAADLADGGSRVPDLGTGLTLRDLLAEMEGE